MNRTGPSSLRGANEWLQSRSMRIQMGDAAFLTESVGRTNMDFDVADHTRDLSSPCFFITRADGLLEDDPKVLHLYCYVPELATRHRYIPDVLADQPLSHITATREVTRRDKSPVLHADWVTPNPMAGHFAPEEMMASIIQPAGAILHRWQWTR